MATFGERTTADEVGRAFEESIVGKNVVITGVRPSSLGLSAVNAIAPFAKTLIIASRTPSRVEEAVTETRRIAPNVDIRIVPLDLLSGEAIRKSAATIVAYDLPIHVLINNSGIMPIPEIAWSEDGFETQFGGDHLGHFLFTSLLFPPLLRSKLDTPGWSPRIVNLSSIVANVKGEIRWEDMHYKSRPEEYDRWIRYSQCKTANALFSLALADKYGKEGILSYSVHPGPIVDTSMGGSVPVDQLISWALFKPDGQPAVYLKNVEEGGATTVYAAFAPDIAHRNGAFLSDCAVYDDIPGYMTSHESAKKLWKVSEEAWNVQFGVKAYRRLRVSNPFTRVDCTPQQARD